MQRPSEGQILGARHNGDVLNILSVTFPFFALVLAGHLAARARLLPLDAIGGLNAFVLYFALPCMLFRFGASTPLAQLLNLPLFLTYLVCQLLMVAGILAFTLGPRINWNDGAFGALVTAFPNTGFMGVPLLVALLGTRAAGPVIVTIATDLVITSSLCIALSRLDTPGGAGVALRKALRGMASNPMPWAILTGALFSGMDWALPGPIKNTVGLLADAASPVALFTIGAVLARSQMLSGAANGHGATESTAHAPVPLADHLPLAAIKLLFHPLLVLLVGAGARQMGLPIDPFALTVAVLVAALPSASNVTLLSERFGANTGRIARIILVSTALAFFTFSGAVALLV